MIILFICSDLFNCLRSVCTITIRTEMAKATSGHLHKENFYCMQPFSRPPTRFWKCQDQKHLDAFDNDKKKNFRENIPDKVLGTWFWLMYFLHNHPRKFKFKQKYEKYGPCFQTIFPFFMRFSFMRGESYRFSYALHHNDAKNIGHNSFNNKHENLDILHLNNPLTKNVIGLLICVPFSLGSICKYWLYAIGHIGVFTTLSTT